MVAFCEIRGAPGGVDVEEGGELEFYFRVRIPRFKLEARSNMLYVDLGGFTVSG